MSRSLLVPLSLLVSVGFVSSASAQPPVNINFQFRFDVEFPHRPQYKNLAPWYSYFPYDPHVHGKPMPYPTWPQAWPPAGATPSPRAESPAPRLPGPIAYQPNYSPIVPTSYAPQYGVPSYWYGR